MSTWPAKKPLTVCVSLDVEEEGLFSGNYPRNCAVENVALLPRLMPLYQELGIPLTLLCAHSVFADARARQTLELMRDKCGAEIGAHLHHWSTPPRDLPAFDGRQPLRSAKMAENALRARLAALFEIGNDFLGAPMRSFRMGRWDLNARWRPLLSDFGVWTDSSICPLRRFAGGPDHFAAPPDPYWVAGKNGKMLEAPITQVALNSTLAKLWGKAFAKNEKMLDYWHFFGALSANPFWHGPKLMRLSVKLHAARGGQVLSLFWHSSEMLPGASPHVPDQATADANLAKIFAFCRWLTENFEVKALTLRQLYRQAAKYDFQDLSGRNSPADW